MIYQDPKQNVELRVKDLLSRMTLSQKISQISGRTIEKNDLEIDRGGGTGGTMLMGTTDPPEEFGRRCEMVFEKLRGQNPWNIPPLIHCEALCGPMMRDQAVFPAPLGMGASFCTELCRKSADVIRQQLLTKGIRQALAPVLDLARDFRWGRTGETYGGDPTLAAAMGCAWIKGLQGEDLKEGVLATGKHFLGYSTPEGGLNSRHIATDRRDLRENMAKPFEAAIRKAGLKSVMVAYGELEGIPLCSSRYLLTKLLREELGFDGFTVSDYLALQMMQQTLGSAENTGEIGKQCLEAGLDMELPDAYAFSSELREQIKRGELAEELLDQAVSRILRQKFELGLFDVPMFQKDRETAQKEWMSLKEKADALSEDAAHASIVLVQNDGVLPLASGQNVALIGPCADSLRLMHNSYTWAAVLDVLLGNGSTDFKSVDELFQKFDGTAKSEEHVQEQVDARLREEHPGAKTVREALLNYFPELAYAKGCGLRDGSETQMQKAVSIAREADVVILALGGKVGWDEACTGGEGIDDVTAELPEIQQQLLEKIADVNPNVVIVHTDGKPLIGEKAYMKSRAVIEAWLPGPMGGSAIADVLCGTYDPGGRLPVDVPRHSGQMPIYYYQRRSAMLGKGYRSVPESPQFPFGYGLSYTTFSYEPSVWHVTEKTGIPVLHVTVTLHNTGTYGGDEVVQLYGQDPSASVARPKRQLLGFQRVHLEKGEKAQVKFQISFDTLSFPDAAGKWKLEAGRFCFAVAKHAEDPGEPYCYECKRTLEIDAAKRSFFAESVIIH